jgi:uncharacterized membrane protein
LPYEWLETPTQGATAELHAWPHRSLPRRGFVWFIATTATGLAVPLLPVVGSPILWGLLPFVLAALWGLWWALRRSYRDAQVIEVLKIWPDRLLLEQRRRGHPARSFETNPYWLRANLSGEGPVEDYLTLTGGPREVELGAFLTPPERRNLCADVQRRLQDLR